MFYNKSRLKEPSEHVAFGFCNRWMWPY